MTVSIKNASLKQPVQAMHKTKQQRDKCVSLIKESLSQKEDLLMLCKKGLIPKQHFTFFDSPTVTTSEERKMILILTVILTVRKMNLLIHIKMVKTYSSDFV